ncbi:MAG: dTMP kinase [Candidatus Micrarchaeota archaeon]|nr:dTMP kinase [Candidatus Micrarchaeota archaeon]
MAGGRYIVFEGIEGSGKSTQARIFYNSIRKKSNAILTEEPWESDSIGKLIRKELKEKRENRVSNATLQLLYMANRKNHMERVVEPGLRKGNTVVQDRYWMSTAVYGSAGSVEKKLYMEYFMKMSEIFPRPDVVFFIGVDPNEAYRRVTSRNKAAERFDRLDMLRKLEIGYRKLETSYEGKWVNIDGNRDVKMVSAEIMRKYRSML